MKRTLNILAITAVASLAALLSAGCTEPAGSGENGDGKGGEAALKKTVRVQTIGRADIADVLSYVADLKPYTEVKIYSPVPDRILYFPWQDGDEIKRGQRIALIRKEGLDKGLEGIVAQMESLDVQIRNLESELERSKGLLAAGVITQATFDKVQTGYLSTLAQRRSLEASRGQLAVTVGNAEITAPIGGVIANKMLEKGDMAVPQVPLCRVLTVDRLKAELKLVEADVAKVRPGMEVKLQFDAYPERPFTGKVTNILPYISTGTRTNTVEVTVDNPVDKKSGHRPLKPGMYGRAELVVAERKGVLVAPEEALLLDNQLLKQQGPDELLRKAFVVADGGVASKRIVRVGVRTGSRYEVLDGLAEGEQIVVRGQHQLKDGQPVEIVKATEN